jgi:hypothetical protein
MEVDVLSSAAPAGAALMAPDGALPYIGCSPELLAGILSCLLRQTVSPREVHERAIGFGLLREPATADGMLLSVHAASRLLLAAYHCPAQLSRGALPELRQHLHRGLRILVAIHAGSVSNSGADFLQILAIHPEAGRSSSVIAVQPGARLSACFSLPQCRFQERWAAAGNFYVVAAHRWEDLAQSGPVFFGGLRDGEGSYHWEVAQCDTDAWGRILRY